MGSLSAMEDLRVGDVRTHSPLVTGPGPGPGPGSARAREVDLVRGQACDVRWYAIAMHRAKKS